MFFCGFSVDKAVISSTWKDATGKSPWRESKEIKQWVSVLGVVWGKRVSGKGLPKLDRFAVQRWFDKYFLCKHAVFPDLSYLFVISGILILLGCTCSLCSPKERWRLCQTHPAPNLRFGVQRWIQVQSWSPMHWMPGMWCLHPCCSSCCLLPDLHRGRTLHLPALSLHCFASAIQTTLLLNKYWCGSVFFSASPYICMQRWLLDFQ